MWPFTGTCWLGCCQALFLGLFTCAHVDIHNISCACHADNNNGVNVNDTSRGSNDTYPWLGFGRWHHFDLAEVRLLPLLFCGLWRVGCVLQRTVPNVHLSNFLKLLLSFFSFPSSFLLLYFCSSRRSANRLEDFHFLERFNFNVWRTARWQLSQRRCLQ